MTTYRYKGKSAGGVDVEGVVEAFDQQDAVRRARENCRVLISVDPVSKAAAVMNMDIGAMLGGGKIKDKTLSLLCSQMAIELKAGLPLVQSLRLVAENEEDKVIAQMLAEVADDVHAGNGLADSFQKRGPKLPRTFIETLRAGEESGKLDECFERLEDYYENAAAVGSKVGSALTYPIMLIVVAVVVVAIIMIKAVPVFEQSFGAVESLPAPTRILIGVSHFFTNNILVIIMVVAALVILGSVFGKTETGSHLYAKLALTFPGISLVNKMNGASQFASTLATMLAAGLPLVQAARITSEVTDNLLIAEDIDSAANGVVEGRRLSDGLKQSKWLPPLLLSLTAVGEETGRMEDTLTVISAYYKKEVDVAVERALGILEPVIVVCMALIVVFILLSVYLPLFSMYGSL